MAETVSYNFLGSGADGFVVDGFHSFNLFAVIGSSIVAVKYAPVYGGTNYNGTMKQGSTQNKYKDLGVPDGARVLGLKILGGNCSVISDASGLANDISVKFWTNEIEFEQFVVSGFLNIDEGTFHDITSQTKTADDYVQFQVDFNVNTGWLEGDPPGDGIELQLNDFLVEITYEQRRKGNMFFGAN